MYYTSMTINDRYEKQDDASKIQKNILNANESELDKKIKPYIRFRIKRRKTVCAMDCRSNSMRKCSICVYG